jgi:YD repeat-containing protein
VTRIEDPLHRSVVRNVFNAAGRLVAQCEAGGNVTTLEGCMQFTLDPNATFQTVINARGFRTDLFLDARGNTTLERHWLDGSNHLDTTRTYDADDNLLTVTDPGQNTWTYTYDANGNRRTRTDPAGRIWTTTYDACNKPVIECDPAGNCATKGYDASCNMTSFTDALGNVTTHEFNDRGQRTAIVDAVGSRTEIQFDSATGYPSGLTDPGGSMTVHFAPNGELRSLIDKDGRRTDFQFDAAHRNTAQVWKVPARTLTIGYDALGRTEPRGPDSRSSSATGILGQVETVDTTGTPAGQGARDLRLRRQRQHDPGPDSRAIEYGTTRSTVSRASCSTGRSGRQARGHQHDPSGAVTTSVATPTSQAIPRARPTSTTFGMLAERHVDPPQAPSSSTIHARLRPQPVGDILQPPTRSPPRLRRPGRLLGGPSGGVQRTGHVRPGGQPLSSSARRITTPTRWAVPEPPAERRHLRLRIRPARKRGAPDDLATEAVSSTTTTEIASPSCASAPRT